MRYTEREWEVLEERHANGSREDAALKPAGILERNSERSEEPPSQGDAEPEQYDDERRILKQRVCAI